MPNKKTTDEYPASNDEKTLFLLAELFRLFGDQTRIRIMCALFNSELCVADIASRLGITQSAISHQLRLLRSSHLVKTRREGRQVFYSLDDNHVEIIIRSGYEHISHIGRRQ